MGDRMEGSSDCFARELVRANRALAMMSKAADALMHAGTEKELLDNICRVLVEDKTYSLCWVGYKTEAGQDQDQDQQDQGMRVVASQGALSGSVDPTRLFGDLPAIALAAGEQRSGPVDAKDGATGEILVMPLTLDNEAIGVLALYSADKDAFDKREKRLLERLAGNVAYGIGMQRLAVDQRLSQCQLKESEARYRILVETAPDAILVHCQGVVIFANASAATLFRADSVDHLTGLRIASLVFASGAPSALAGLDESEGAHCAAFEEHLQRFDGTSFTAEVTFAPITFHGMHAHQMFIRDITRRKHVHSQLVQTAKLATLGEMAAGMAHELSQPINIIRMAAEGALLLIERGKANQDYQTGQFALMASQAGRMAEIIDHIRIFSRKEPGEVVVYDAALTLKRAVDLMHPQLLSGGVMVRADLCNTPARVEGRPIQLEQVIINLLTNAADAIREHNQKTGQTAIGEVTIISEKKSSSLLQIVVSDNVPASVPKIWTAFSNRSSPPRKSVRAPGLACRSVSASSGRWAEPCAPSTAHPAARRSSSPCL